MVVAYYGFTIVCGGPMFMAFVGYPCPQIYIPTNLYSVICWIFIEIIQITPKTKLYPHKRGKILATHKHWPPRIKLIPQYTRLLINMFWPMWLCFTGRNDRPNRIQRRTGGGLYRDGKKWHQESSQVPE